MEGKGTTTGLEEIGVPGREHLRNALTTCSDPLALIDEFQVSIQLHSGRHLVQQGHLVRYLALVLSQGIEKI